MMGSVFCDDEGEYVVVTGTATSKLDASKVSVRFDKESYNQLFASMDSSEGEGVVGWYHSHPGFGCYMSDTDIRTHQGIFGEDAGFAIVIDPAESELAAFSCFGGVPQKIPMIVMEM